MFTSILRSSVTIVWKAPKLIVEFGNRPSRKWADMEQGNPLYCLRVLDLFIQGSLVNNLINFTSELMIGVLFE